MQSSKDFELIKKILPSDIAVIAIATNSSEDYCRKVLKGKRKNKSDLAIKIVFAARNLISNRLNLVNRLIPIKLDN